MNLSTKLAAVAALSVAFGVGQTQEAKAQVSESAIRQSNRFSGTAKDNLYVALNCPQFTVEARGYDLIVEKYPAWVGGGERAVGFVGQFSSNPYSFGNNTMIVRVPIYSLMFDGAVEVRQYGTGIVLDNDPIIPR